MMWIFVIRDSNSYLEQKVKVDVGYAGSGLEVYEGIECASEVTRDKYIRTCQQIAWIFIGI